MNNFGILILIVIEKPCLIPNLNIINCSFKVFTIRSLRNKNFFFMIVQTINSSRKIPFLNI